MASHIRLRLMVRRNGLPDTNVVWPVALEANPTVARLLEQVNDIIPLESGEWGLEDYAVELGNGTGAAFECLHFQPIQDVLKDDDQVFIRPLFTDDLRRRRIGGRIQISSDGRHLVDGISFGRPMLNYPAARPALRIPPRKRRRVGFDQDEEDDEEWMEEEEGYGDDYDDNYEDGEDEDPSMLLLTNGEEEQAPRAQKRVRIAAEFDDLDQEVEDDAAVDGDSELGADGVSGSTEERNDLDSDLDQDEDGDLAKELEDLQNEMNGEVPNHNPDPPNSTSTRRTRSALRTENRADGKRSTSNLPGNLEALDKLGALRAAFRDVPVRVCREVLTAEDSDLKKSYLALIQGFKPKISESELLKRWKNRHGGGPESSALHSSTNTTSLVPQADVANGQDEEGAVDGDDESEHDDEDSNQDVTTFIRRFDHQGLPPGSISSGNALEAMATLANSFGGTKATSASSVPRKKTFQDEDDETCSSETSSSSEEEEEDEADSDASQNEHSEKSSSSESDDETPGTSGNANAGPEGDDSDTSSSDSSSDSDSDSGPEETSTKGGVALKTSASARVPFTSSSNVISNSGDGSDVDDDISDLDSSSASEGENHVRLSVKKTRGQAGDSAIESYSNPPSDPARPLVPPGQGKSATQKRNARRRVAQRAKKEASQIPSTGTTGTGTPPEPSASVSDEREQEKTKQSELFEARRQALLDALASGGVEVGPNNAFGFDASITPRGSSKRKRPEKEPAVEKADEKSREHVSEEVETQSPDSAQKRRRLDLGAGRRILFGALGLRNPKTKEDEEKLRGNLMKDVRPLQNARLVEDETAELEKTDQAKPQDEDPDAWRAKIVYSAVECCQEGVELSEPPFPFVQRWDPQQQGSWHRKMNKRGGRGKRADRNQSHFYQDGTQEYKGTHNESQDWDESYYDALQTTGEANDANIILNYDDDDVAPDPSTNDAENNTSADESDDLPALPANPAELKALSPSAAQCGMVITWKQMILSKATNWQPQVLSLTGVICRIHDEAGLFEIMLAKRDRYLEEPEKEYDGTTGQRIYDKFDVPDLGDEEDEDEDEEAKRKRQGFRTLSFATIMEPLVVQPPIPPDEAVEENAVHSIEKDRIEDHVETRVEDRVEDRSEPEMEAEMSVGAKDTPFEGFDDVVDEPHEEAPEAMDTTLNGAESSTTGTDVQPPNDPEPEHVQHSESLTTGTTKTPSVGSPKQDQQSANVPSSDVSQVLSPSYQLYNETFTQFRDESTQKSTSDGQPNDSVHPKVDVPPPSSAGSVGSGRQPDCSIRVDSNIPDSFLRVTDESHHSDENHNESQVAFFEGSPVADSNGDKTPTPSQAQELQTNDGRQVNLDTAPKQSTPTPKVTPKKRDEEIESPASTPCSLTSLGTPWCTAVSRAESPSKTQLLSSIKSQKSKASKAKDADYEAAMRKLDNFSEDEDSQDTGKSVNSPSSRPVALSSSITGAADNDRDMNGSSGFEPPSSLQRARARAEAKISPPPTTRGKGRKPLGLFSGSRSSPEIKEGSPPPATKRSTRSSQPNFTVPPGSQVFEISSDSDQPVLEDYADDEVDENYAPDSLPSGPGWVKKNHSTWATKTPLASQKQKRSSFAAQLGGVENNAAVATKKSRKGRMSGSRN